MVELTLPKNSQPSKGKTWPKPAGSRLREYRVYRYDPDSEANPRIDPYFRVPRRCGPLVLHGPTATQNESGPTPNPRRPPGDARPRRRLGGARGGDPSQGVRDRRCVQCDRRGDNDPHLVRIAADTQRW